MFQPELASHRFYFSYAVKHCTANEPKNAGAYNKASVEPWTAIARLAIEDENVCVGMNMFAKIYLTWHLLHYDMIGKDGPQPYALSSHLLKYLRNELS